MIAAEALKKETPDGHTFMIANNAPFTIAPTMFKNVAYDAVRDFTHITYLGSTYGGCVAHPKVGARNLAELVAKAKASPGKLTFGSSGNGSIGHIAGETFKRLAGVDLLHVPYKGAAQLRQDLLAGIVDVSFEGVLGALAFVRGRLRWRQVATLSNNASERLCLRVGRRRKRRHRDPAVPQRAGVRKHPFVRELLQLARAHRPACRRLSPPACTWFSRALAGPPGGAGGAGCLWGVLQRPMTTPEFDAYVASAGSTSARPQIVGGGLLPVS
jgi:hypothetical protein